jgi:hypothetical protein
MERSRWSGKAGREKKRRVACKSTVRCAQAVSRAGSGKGERGSTRDGWTRDGKREGKRRTVHGTDPENLNARTNGGIGGDLPLSVEMADRAIVTSPSVLVAVPWRGPVLRRESRVPMALAR